MCKDTEVVHDQDEEAVQNYCTVKRTPIFVSGLGVQGATVLINTSIDCQDEF